MKKYLWLLLLLFTVKCKMPFGNDVTYHHCSAVTLGASGSTWQVTLKDGRTAYLPFMWTIIEEERKDGKDED